MHDDVVGTDNRRIDDDAGSLGCLETGFFHRDRITARRDRLDAITTVIFRFRIPEFTGLLICNLNCRILDQRAGGVACNSHQYALACLCDGGAETKKYEEDK